MARARARWSRRGTGPATLERALQILFLLEENPSGMSVAALVEGTGCPRATLYRYLSLLESHALVSQVPDGRGGGSGRYTLGNRLIALASKVPVERELVRALLPRMVELSQRLGETVILVQPIGLQAICIERVEHPARVRLSFEKGAVLPLHAGASARVLLAYMSDEEVERVIRTVGLPRYTERTITDPAQLREVLAETRRRGWAVSDEEMDPGVRAVAVAILDASGHPRAAISVVGPIFRLQGEKTEQALELLGRLRDELKAKPPWGGEDPEGG